MQPTLGISMESEVTEASIVKHEMSATTRWLIAGFFGMLITAGGFWVKESAGDIAEKKDTRHDQDIYAHPQAFEKWQKFQRSETDRIITEIRKR